MPRGTLTPKERALQIFPEKWGRMMGEQHGTIEKVERPVKKAPKKAVRA